MMDPKCELHKNAVATARRKELETYQRALDIQWLNSRMEDGRMGRCLALIKKEAEMEKNYQERTDHAAIVNAQAVKEAAIGVEIADIQRVKDCALQRRHYLRRRDPMLRELSKKLQAGYICRDLKQQILQNQYRKLQEEAEFRNANNYLLKALNDDNETRDKEERDKMERNSKYCKELQQQLVNRQLQKQCQYEDTLIEKKMLEDVMQTLADEDKREVEQKRRLMEKTKNEMITFQQARVAWKEKQKEMVIIESKQIEEQLKQASDRSSAIIEARQRKLREKEEMNEMISAKILAAEAEIQDRMNTIKLLQEQEYLEKNVQDDIAKGEKFERVKRDTKEALTAQMENRKKLDAETKEREKEFRLKAEAKMAEDDAKEREKQRKKREQGRMYSQELLRQIKSNEIKRAKEQEGENRRVQIIKDYDNQWLEEVAVERKKMIGEHAAGVLGYIQGGVLRHDDLPHVRPEAVGLDPAQVEMMGRPRTRRAYDKCNPQCQILRRF